MSNIISKRITLAAVLKVGQGAQGQRRETRWELLVCDPVDR